MAMTCSRYPSPSPPHSSSTVIPCSPSSPIAGHSSRGKTLLASISAARGAMFAAAKRAVDSRIASAVSPRPKSIESSGITAVSPLKTGDILRCGPLERDGGQHKFLSPAQTYDLAGLVDAAEVEDLLQSIDARGGLMIVRDDEIARLQAGRRGRAAALDALYAHPGFIVQPMVQG